MIGLLAVDTSVWPKSTEELCESQLAVIELARKSTVYSIIICRLRTIHHSYKQNL